MIAEIGYIIMVPFAIVEAALSLIAKVFSYPLPISEEKHSKISTWLTESMLAVRYSIANAILNPFRLGLLENRGQQAWLFKQDPGLRGLEAWVLKHCPEQ